jgi:hypothetical protein
MLRPHLEQRASDLLSRGALPLALLSSLRNPLLAACCLLLRYRAVALPLEDHAACAQDEMTMAAATHALPALQLQQSRKLCSHTPNKHCREPARAHSRGSLLALSHLVAHTHCAAPGLVLSAVAQQPKHTLGGARGRGRQTPNIKTTCLAMAMVVVWSWSWSWQCSRRVAPSHHAIPPSHTLHPRSQPAPSGSRRLWH